MSENSEKQYLDVHSYFMKKRNFLACVKIIIIGAPK
jgi:hypothetical protein